MPEHLKKYSANQAATERNKIYAQRSSNPVVIPLKLTDIPLQLASRYDQIDELEIIFEGELMKYKPGIKH